MMSWSTKYLLESAIKNLEEKEYLSKCERIVLSQYKKELALLKRLDIERVDMDVSEEEFEEYIKNSSIYIMNKDVFNDMERKSFLLDKIKCILRS